MKLSAIDENVARYFKLSGTDGVLVSEVATDGPADDAGIEPGDVIIAINGRPTLRDEDVNIAILDGEVNQKLKLTVLRSGEKKDLTMTLQARPRSGGVRN
ncbi:MAG: PDZ domain-containing protein [Ignavibacteria bacterium]|nr:PDZ domain-containing protein [Ignavibacteria bacterium]